MAEAPPLTQDLALRIERSSGRAIVKDTPTHKQFGETFAGKTTGGWDRNWVMCFGAQDIDRLDEILAFYVEDGQVPRFALAPMRFSREVASALTAAGYAHQGYEQATLYGLPETTPEPLPAGVTIEEVTPDNLDAFVRLSADAFDWAPEWRDAAMESMRNNHSAGSYRYLARYEGEPAGVAILGVRDDGMASLGHGGVITRFRRKGCHLALIHHRLFVAHQLGCPLVISGANYNSASFRNQQRAGLRLAFVECEWTRT